MQSFKYFIGAAILGISTILFAGGLNFSADFNIDRSTAFTNQVVRFTDASTKGTCPIDPGRWEWDFGEGAVPATANTQGPHDVTYSTIGTKAISLRVFAPDGQFCSSASVLKSIEITQAPIPTMSQWGLLILALVLVSLATVRIWNAQRLNA